MNNLVSGKIEENGVGKLSHITHRALEKICELGISHIWYTGILEHATMTDYSEYDIKKDPPEIVKGRAGSPYAVKDFYDVCPDLAENVEQRIIEFEDLIQRTHQNKLKAIIDFIPNHVARVYYSDKKPENESDLGERDDISMTFHPQNDFYYLPEEELKLPEKVIPLSQEEISKNSTRRYTEKPARVSGNDCLRMNPSKDDWYDTVKLNYGVNYFDNQKTYFSPIPPLWWKMKNILLYWINKGVDGFRCDMVEMVPLSFWKWIIPQIKIASPNVIFIGESYQPDKYMPYIKEANFDYLYDKVILYDTLKSIITRRHSANELASCWQRTENISENMLGFLENHDEHRIASTFFVRDPKKAFPAMIIASTLTKGSIMIYFGQEIGEKGKQPLGFSGKDGKTSIFDYGSMKQFRKWVNGGKFNQNLLSSKQKKIRRFYQKLFYIVQNHSAIYEGNLYDLQYFNITNPYYPDNNVYTYFKYTKSDVILVTVNFSSIKCFFQVRIPEQIFHFIPNLLALDNEWQAVDLMSQNIYQLEASDIIERGIPITLKKYGFLVLNISLD